MTIHITWKTPPSPLSPTWSLIPHEAERNRERELERGGISKSKKWRITLVLTLTLSHLRERELSRNIIIVLQWRHRHGKLFYFSVTSTHYNDRGGLIFILFIGSISPNISPYFNASVIVSATFLINVK